MFSLSTLILLLFTNINEAIKVKNETKNNNSLPEKEIMKFNHDLRTIYISQSNNGYYFSFKTE